MNYNLIYIGTTNLFIYLFIYHLQQKFKGKTIFYNVNDDNLLL